MDTNPWEKEAENERLQREREDENESLRRIISHLRDERDMLIDRVERMARDRYYHMEKARRLNRQLAAAQKARDEAVAALRSTDEGRRDRLAKVLHTVLVDFVTEVMERAKKVDTRMEPR